MSRWRRWASFYADPAAGRGQRDGDGQRDEDGDEPEQVERGIKHGCVSQIVSCGYPQGRIMGQISLAKALFAIEFVPSGQFVRWMG